MVEEIEYECQICGKTKWEPEIPTECPDCLSTSLDKINTRKRDEDNGVCSVGAPDDVESDVDCELIATHTAEITQLYEDGTNTRKICDYHKKLWDGSDHVEEFNSL